MIRFKIRVGKQVLEYYKDYTLARPPDVGYMIHTPKRAYTIRQIIQLAGNLYEVQVIPRVNLWGWIKRKVIHAR